MWNDQPALYFLDGATRVFSPFPMDVRHAASMDHRIITGALCGVLTMPMLAQASTGNVGTIMETFVVRQFPNAVGDYIWGSTKLRGG